MSDEQKPITPTIIKQDHFPFSDGSGYEFSSKVEVRNNGDVEISIINLGTAVTMTGDQWLEIRQHVESCIVFLAHRCREECA